MAAALSLSLLACAPVRQPGSPPASVSPASVSPASVSPASVSPASVSPAAQAASAELDNDRLSAAPRVISPAQARIFDAVAEARGLPWKVRTAPTTISRDEAYRRIVALNEKNVPPTVMRALGELLRGLRLVGKDDDLLASVYRLARANLAGFYDQHADRMFLIDDLSDAIAGETLTHELVHALQDQHFDLARWLTYRPHAGDAVSAVHGLCEGGATVATFEITLPGMVLSQAALRFALMASLAMSEEGATTPRVLQASLVASYIDGYGFVQALRRRGGWAEVNRAWQSPPETTEQLIHIEKYDAREAALPIATLDKAAAAPGYRVFDSDAMGEQGLRIVLEQWVHRARAAEAAAGWGGDRYTVLVRNTAPGNTRPGNTAPGKDDFLVLWQLRFDTQRDADEVAAVFEKRFAKGCEQGKQRGAVRWRHHGDRIDVVANHTAGTTCASLEKTLNAL
jgi:hypothetical protein